MVAGTRAAGSVFTVRPGGPGTKITGAQKNSVRSTVPRAGAVAAAGTLTGGRHPGAPHHDPPPHHHQDPPPHHQQDPPPHLQKDPPPRHPLIPAM